MLASSSPVAANVNIPVTFQTSLQRLQSVETRARLTFAALDGLRQGLGGLPRQLVERYNATITALAPVLDRRLQEYVSAGGDASARSPLPRIVDLSTQGLGVPAILQTIRSGAARGADWIPADRLAVAIDGGAASSSGLADWSAAVDENRAMLANTQRSDLGIPAIAIIAIVLGVSLVAAIVADVVRTFHADTTKQAALDAEARALEAQVAVIQARIVTYEKTLSQCMATRATPAECAELAVSAALRVGEVPSLPSRAASPWSLSVSQKVGLAAVSAGILAAGFFGVRRIWRRREIY